MQTEAIDAALRPLSEALESDGYVVGFELSDGSLQMRVTAGPEACAECLVPKPLMTDLIVQALGDAGFPLAPGEFRLIYPGEQ